MSRAVPTTLGERVQESEAQDAAAQVPDDLDEALTSGESGQQFDYADFQERVASRAEKTAAENDPDRVSEKVTSVLVEAENRGEIRDLVSQLPKGEGYGGLLSDADEAETE